MSQAVVEADAFVVVMVPVILRKLTLIKTR